MTLRQIPGLSPNRSITRRSALALGTAAGGLMLSARYAAAVVRLDITEGNFQPLPIAIPNFIAGAAADNDTALGVTQIITGNLRSVRPAFYYHGWHRNKCYDRGSRELAV